MVDLLLDPELRTWVLFPILMVMVLYGVLRHYITVLLQSSSKPLDKAAAKQASYLQYSRALREHYLFLPKDAFVQRKEYYAEAFREGKFVVNTSGGKPNPLNDPSAMSGMMESMKGQIMMYVPQTLMMQWINSFFAGFILMELPFPLTIRFKSMLQSGVATQDLDVRWVSSLSWYFLNLFGLNSVYSIILGSENQATQALNQQGMPNFQPGVDFAKLYKSEADSLEIITARTILDNVEKRVFAGL